MGAISWLNAETLERAPTPLLVSSSFVTHNTVVKDNEHNEQFYTHYYHQRSIDRRGNTYCKALQLMLQYNVIPTT